MSDLISRQAEQQGRVFKEIVAEYPSYNTYPEYEGKPYFSIKYTENGQEFIGYGTYKPEVLSEYLKEYFMSSAQPELPIKEKCAYCPHCDNCDVNDDLSIAQPVDKDIDVPSTDTISRQSAIDALGEGAMVNYQAAGHDNGLIKAIDVIKGLPSAQPDIAEKLYQYKCYITDREGFQHEVIHVGDIRRVTGWEI